MRKAAILLSFIATGLVAGGTLAGEAKFPPRKAGQWEIKLEPPAGAPAMTMQVCLDAATDSQLMQSGMTITGSQCSKMDVQQQAGGYVIDSICSFGKMKTTSHVVMSGDFNSAYTVDMTSDIEGGPKQMPPHSTMKQEATWKGECSGLTPGEMMMPGGMKVNVTQMMKKMGG
jgi:hypothetical protein